MPNAVQRRDMQRDTQNERFTVSQSRIEYRVVVRGNLTQTSVSARERRV